MDYTEIKKMTAVKLREIIAAKYPEEKGLVGLKKEQLVELLATKLGIDKHVHAAVGIDKTSIKQKIRALKKEREELQKAGGNAEKLRALRHAIHKQKHILRRAVREAEIAAAHGKA